MNEHVNDYTPIRDSIRIRSRRFDSSLIRFEQKFLIRMSLDN